MLPSTIFTGGVEHLRRVSPDAPPMEVSEASHPLVEKPLDPFVDKTSVETDLGSNVGDGHTLGQE